MAPPIAQSTRCRAGGAGQPISRRGPWSPHVAATFLPCGHRGLKTSAIWLVFVAAHAEKLVGLLDGAALTEHLNAMGARRSSAAAPYPGPGSSHGGRLRSQVARGLASCLRHHDLRAAGTCALW